MVKGNIAKQSLENFLGDEVAEDVLPLFESSKECGGHPTENYASHIQFPFLEPEEALTPLKSCANIYGDRDQKKHGIL